MRHRTEILWPRIGFSLSLLWKIFSRYDSGGSIVSNVLCLEYELGDSGFEYREEKGIFFSANCPDRLWCPPILRFVIGFLRGVKRPGREADHPFSSSAEFNNEWSFTRILNIFTACTGTRHFHFVTFLLM